MSQHVAILGGGLTGLSTAFHLARRFPSTRISLLEQNERLGGWVRSKRVKIQSNHAAPLLEAGPRTLRPNSKSVLELINLLGLSSQVITVPKTSPAAQSRYLYIPPSHNAAFSGLQRIPSSISTLVSSPLIRVLLPAIVQEALKLNNRPNGIEDESVDSFLSRRFGPSFARTFGSALIHGIYASDSRKVSVRAAFSGMWDAEERGFGSLVRGSLLPKKTKVSEEYEIGNVEEMMHGVSVYSFKDGMQTLTDALETKLKTSPNVQILPDSAVSSINENADKSFELTLSSGRTLAPSHVVSAIPTSTLQSLLALSNLRRSISQRALEILTTNPTSSVHVVNLVFNGAPAKHHPAGFGYLIPRPPQGYPTHFHNFGSIGILGTVFDACSLSAQDEPSIGGDAYENAAFTKLTVMIGGPYPLPPLPSVLSSSDGASSQAELPKYIKTVLGHLSTHLSRPLPPPIYWRISPNDRCIPTLLPGHLQRVQELRGILRERFGDTFEVVGAGIGGVSVGDCVEAGRRVALGWV